MTGDLKRVLRDFYVKQCHERSIENMSYFLCPDCGKKLSVFGESHIDKIAERYNTKVLARLPIDPDLAKNVDNGKAEAFEGGYLDEAAEEIDKILEK